MSESAKRTWKAFPLVWEEIALNDHETDKFRPLTELQSAILLGAIEHYRWPTRWVGLGISAEQLEKEIAEIKDRLMREAGGFLMTPEEFYDANKRSIYDAWNDIAKQIVSGRTTGFVVGEDGTVTDPTTGVDGVELPPDDPTTEYDETRAANYGGTIAVGRGIELFLDKVDAYYGATNGTPATPLATAQTQLKIYFECDGAFMDSAVSTYYTYRAGNPRILFDATNAFMLYMYCAGSDLRAFLRWMVDLSGYAAEKQTVVNGLMSALLPEFFTNYYVKGVLLPSTAYVDADCVPMPYQEYFEIPYNTSRVLLPTVGKGGHRLDIETGGYYLDPDGDTQDPFWYRTAAGVLTRTNFTFVYGAGSNMPSDSQVVYNAAHVYRYTIDLPVGNNSWNVQFNRTANMNVSSTSPTNGFYIKIRDLGKYTL